MTGVQTCALPIFRKPPDDHLGTAAPFSRTSSPAQRLAVPDRWLWRPKYGSVGSNGACLGRAWSHCSYARVDPPNDVPTLPEALLPLTGTHTGRKLSFTVALRGWSPDRRHGHSIPQYSRQPRRTSWVPASTRKGTRRRAPVWDRISIHPVHTIKAKGAQRSSGCMSSTAVPRPK